MKCSQIRIIPIEFDTHLTQVPAEYWFIFSSFLNEVETFPPLRLRKNVVSDWSA